MQCDYYLDSAAEKKRYALHNNSLLNTGYVRYLESFIDSVLGFPAIFDQKNIKMQEIVDYGSGPEPSLATLLQKRGFTVRCYDPYFAPEMVLPGKLADFVTCLEVAEHFKEPIKDFALIVNCIRENGFLALATHLMPAFTNETEQIAFFSSWWYRQDPTHVSFFTEKALRIVAGGAGLSWLGQAGPHIYIFKKNREVLR